MSTRLCWTIERVASIRNLPGTDAPTLSVRPVRLRDSTDGPVGELLSLVELEEEEMQILRQQLTLLRAQHPPGTLPPAPALQTDRQDPLAIAWEWYDQLNNEVMRRMFVTRVDLSLEIAQRALEYTQTAIHAAEYRLQTSTTRKMVFDVMRDTVGLEDNLNLAAEKLDPLRGFRLHAKTPSYVRDAQLLVKQGVNDARQRLKDLNIRAVRAYQHLP